MSTVQINHLSVTYSSKGEVVEAVKDLSLSLSEGGIYSVIGPSGSGKSTLLHVLGGIIKDYEGEVLINGIKPDPKIHSIGLVPQNYGLLPWKKVKENILLATKIRKSQPDDIFYNEIIQALDLEGFIHRYPNELSGGQQQRVALARSFIQKPDLLLMDEPFSALDALTAEKSRNLFIDVWKKHKVTTLFITHNIEEAVRMGKYIVLLSKCPGRILHIVNNPLIGTGTEKTPEAYLELSGYIRELISKEWQ